MVGWCASASMALYIAHNSGRVDDIGPGGGRLFIVIIGILFVAKIIPDPISFVAGFKDPSVHASRLLPVNTIDRSKFCEDGEVVRINSNCRETSFGVTVSVVSCDRILMYHCGISIDSSIVGICVFSANWLNEMVLLLSAFDTKVLKGFFICLE
jgi:hypothetical protein